MTGLHVIMKETGRRESLEITFKEQRSKLFRDERPVLNLKDVKEVL